MFLTRDEINKIGFKSVGSNVLISDKAVFYRPERISIGNNVRIDDFCVLSGQIQFGNNIHIGVGSVIFSSHNLGGDIKIEFDDFSTLSSRCAIYAITDDYSGLTMTNPTIPDKYRGVIKKSVYVGKHCIVGTGTTIMPGANLAEGVSVGAMSLVTKPTQEWKIYAGIPAKIIKDRKRDLLKLEKQINFRYNML